MAMRSMEEARKLWRVTIDASPDLANLKLHVRPNVDVNPCLSGLRSVCWKTFLLFRSTDRSKWPSELAESREAYTSLKEHLLRYIQHPEELGSSLDPLDDDQSSPWNTLRKDEELRAEIFQDVERCMPDEPYFRQPVVQRTLLDVLFIFCKLNQDVGYRQGMHELLAPILWVVEQDAISHAAVDPASQNEIEQALMLDVLDATYMEHDTFTLFALVMQSAKSFYELGEPEKRKDETPFTSGEQRGTGPIVARSKHVHEVLLASVDPELSSHMTEIEILPQIFLIRWIRLLFGREFPFDDLLGLWDVLFAEDPTLELVDLVSISMLLRIRWQLLEADYSVALSLLLKYPQPDTEHGPQSFVEDAAYLKDHLNIAGGREIIIKYSGKAPSSNTKISHVPPSGSLSPERRPTRKRSPLPSPASFLKQQGGMEALLQGAAKGVFERGEKLGINQAVRDAMGEVKKNMQGLAAQNNSVSLRRPIDGPRWSLDEGRSIPSSRKSVVAMEARNSQLGSMLDEALNDLRAVSKNASSDSPSVAAKLDIAIAKIQFIQVYLEDSSMPLAPPEQDKQPPPQSTNTAAKNTVPNRNPIVQENVENLMKEPPQIQVTANTQMSPPTDSLRTGMDKGNSSNSDAKVKLDGSNATDRPKAPVPTRSSLAQSSFAWMLESSEGKTGVEPHGSPPASKPSSTFLNSNRKPTSGASRERAAFLFGDEVDEVEKPRNPSVASDPEAGYILGTMRSPSKR